MRTFSAMLFIPVLAALARAGFAQVDDPDPAKAPWRFGLTFENDLLAGTDRYYTNGVKLALASPPWRGDVPAPGIPRPLQSLGRAFAPPRPSADRRFFSFFLGQEMYTPIDIWRPVPAADDPPYAGFLYAGMGFHRFGPSLLDSLTLVLGIVGPSSLAGAAQRAVHKAFGFERPAGWAHQLKDEPVLGVAFDRKGKIRPAAPSGRFGWDLVGHAGGALSNAVTEAAGGVLVRAGWGLPEDFGSARQRLGIDVAGLCPDDGFGARAAHDLDFYGFAGVDVHAVLRDIVLDGNSFRDGPSVEKVPLAADVTAGLAVRGRRFEIRFSYVYRTPRFVGERKRFVYGSLSAVFGLGR